MKMLQLITINNLAGTSVQYLPADAIWRHVSYDGYGLQVWAECSDNAPQAQYSFRVVSAGIYFEEGLEFVGKATVGGYPMFLYARRMG
jgi:hypothetical protein